MIYLDYNATTPIDPAVAEAMRPYVYDNFGNPSSGHALGRAAKDAVEHARGQIAGLLGAKNEEIVFTSGGSESNNTVLKGAAHTFRSKGNHIVTSQIEHPAILNPCHYLEKIGYEITYLPVDKYGIVDPSDVKKNITDKTILVTIMHANNETGSIQPIQEISAICRKRGVLSHTDAAQSIGKIHTRVDDLGVDFLSVAGHKLYAPKGVGALYIRKGVAIEPLIHGAGHESGRRAGTENVIFDVGLGKACEIAAALPGMDKVREVAGDFFRDLENLFGQNIRLHGHPTQRLPNTLYLGFLNLYTPDVLAALSDVAVSTGSACHSGATSISSVLRAMGLDESTAGATIRFSLGRQTIKSEIDTVLNRLATVKLKATR